MGPPPSCCSCLSLPSFDCLHLNTRLADGRPAIIIDPGSVWDLSGDQWAKGIAVNCSKHGYKPTYEQRSTPLNVSGVGNGSQQCNFDAHLPIALKTMTGEVRVGDMNTPTISESDLPGLMGLTAMEKNRAVLDVNTKRLYFLGPGDYELDQEVPPGTAQYTPLQRIWVKVMVAATVYNAFTTLFN